MDLRTFITAIVLFTVISGTVFAASGSTADPTEIGIGARPLGLGKAYVGFSDDANSLFMNPAGLAKIDGLKINSMSGQVIQDLNYIVFGAAQPYDFGTMAIGYVNVNLPDIPITTVTGGITKDVVPLGATDYNASVILVSYSNDMKKLPMMNWIENATYGVNFKYFMQGFTGGGVTMEGANGTGFDMDLGMQYSPSKPWVFGLNAINVLPESMGGKFTWVRNNVVENIPMVLKIGTKAKLMGKEDSIYGGSQDLFLGIDADTFPTQTNMPSVLHIGTEWWPSKIMALRLGIDQMPKAAVGGVGVENNLTAGIGMRASGFTFDYCYHQYSDLPENVTHFFSIGYVGVEDKQPKVVQKPKVLLPVIVPKLNLRSFSDVPESYWAKGPIEFMAALNVMDGYDNGTFKPEEPVTRAQFAKILVLLKELEPNETSSDPFPDVPRMNWAAKYIKAASFMKFMGAYPDGTFKPDQKVSRAEGVITLTRFESLKVPKLVEKKPYPDVPKWHWSAGAITAAKKQGYLDYLMPDSNFEMDKLMTRAELAEMLSKTEYGKMRIRKLLED